ncbi:DUF1569 domain-containing protein [Leptospira terpstrae]|uniref:Four helix bundle metalloprotein n=1 Tax=Leptospira terpstrae serovar Hualin str. LT 11-33 = ATCC 700639 TaxID=1257025 RepID=N1W2M7_9LEPT|nr:DUF1569 domain-containing protein [Leptospira terpstrae]EMY61911.1 four helix bundle metalloprotein [Leptospira terpstrae serovar Hualin str. LT 11-33 = ATCC 700639]
MKRKEFLQKTALSYGILNLPLRSEGKVEEETKTEIESPWLEAEDLTDLRTLLVQLQSDSKEFKLTGNWSPGKVFAHCAQSIEYSLKGYPEMKSSFFRGSVGKVAFSIFAFKNKMNHGLEEPIPGAEDISNETELKVGIKKLIQAIDDFSKAKESSLRPHFAYGELTKEEYDVAHSLHIKNHMERVLV